MNSKRLYQLLVGLIILSAIGMVAGVYIISSQLAKQSQVLAEQRQQLAVLDGREGSLQRAKADINKYRELAQIAKSIVPQDKSQAQTIGEIVKLANANGVKLGSFSFPNSSLGDKAGAQAKLSQLEKIKDIAGVYGLQIMVQSSNESTVNYANFINFLEALEQNRRTAQVTNITITPNPSNPNRISFSLTLQEYIKP